MTNERTRLQRKAAEPASAASRAGSAGDGRIAGSPAMRAQRKQLASAFGGAAQLAPDEEMQMKAADAVQQMPQEEELPKT